MSYKEIERFCSNCDEAYIEDMLDGRYLVCPKCGQKLRIKKGVKWFDVIIPSANDSNHQVKVNESEKVETVKPHIKTLENLLVNLDLENNHDIDKLSFEIKAKEKEHLESLRLNEFNRLKKHNDEYYASSDYKSLERFWTSKKQKHGISGKRSIVNCSNCKTRYFLKGDIPECDLICNLCAFSFKLVLKNRNSKKSEISLFLEKRKHLKFYDLPFLWLKIKNLNFEKLHQMKNLFTKPFSQKLQSWLIDHQCIECGKIPEVMKHKAGGPLTLVCLSCHSSLERLERNEDPLSHHVYVYRIPVFIRNRKYHNSISNDESNEIIFDNGSDSWTDEDIARIKEENGFSDDDIANGAWIDF